MRAIPTLSLLILGMTTILHFGCRTNCPSDKACQSGQFLAAVRERTGLGDVLVLDHFHAQNASSKDTGVIVLLASTPDHMLVDLFAPKGDSKTGEGPPGFCQVAQARIKRDGKLSMQPAKPILADFDGDGCHDVILSFATFLADRHVLSVLIFSRVQGRWSLLGPPLVLRELRPVFRKMKIRVDYSLEDKFTRVSYAGQDLLQQGFSHGGRLLPIPRPAGGGDCLLVQVKFKEVRIGATFFSSALLVYQVKNGQFCLDPGWNRGQPILLPAQHSAKGLNLNALVKMGWNAK